MREVNVNTRLNNLGGHKQNWWAIAPALCLKFFFYLRQHTPAMCGA